MKKSRYDNKWEISLCLIHRSLYIVLLFMEWICHQSQIAKPKISQAKACNSVCRDGVVREIDYANRMKNYVGMGWEYRIIIIIIIQKSIFRKFIFIFNSLLKKNKKKNEMRRSWKKRKVYFSFFSPSWQHDVIISYFIFPSLLSSNFFRHRRKAYINFPVKPIKSSSSVFNLSS